MCPRQSMCGLLRRFGCFGYHSQWTFVSNHGDEGTGTERAWLMTAKKSRSTHRSAKTGTLSGDVKVSKGGGKVAKTPQAKLSGAKMSRTKEKVPVMGRLIKLDTIDRDGARVLEQVITGASEVTISTGAGKTATLSGSLLSVLRNVAAALERGESVTVLGEDPEADLGDAVISSQEAADLLNVSRPFVVKLAKTGQLAHHMVGNRHRFNMADVLAYAEQMRTERSEALTALAPAGGYTTEDF